MMSSLDLNKSRVKYSRKVKQAIRPFRVSPELEDDKACWLTNRTCRTSAGEKHPPGPAGASFLLSFQKGENRLTRLSYANIDTPASLLYIPGFIASHHRSLITMDRKSPQTVAADFEAIWAALNETTQLQKRSNGRWIK